MKKTILVVDDDRVFNHLLVDQIGDMGFDAVGALNWQEAASRLSELEPDLVLLDLKLPDADSGQVVKEVSAQYPVVVLTGYGSIRNAVDLIQAGAREYLTKPVSLDELELTIRQTLEHAQLQRSNALYKRQLQSHRPGPLIGESKAMQEVNALIDAVAPTDATVLIQGESGTGKEMVALAIHERSTRQGREMVTVDGSTLQDNLFESELFGHERGAFTGADRQKRGMVEEAEGSTLFLDEIGETSSANQAKLLRLFESGTYRRLGGTKTLRAGVRFVVATNRDLGRLSSEGGFREDLYFRLASFIITVPPLRERRDDIPLLARHFLHRFGRGDEYHFSAEATKLLSAYDWPGNVRELRNVVERAVILSRGQSRIGADLLSALAPRRDGAVTLSFDSEPTLQDIEKDYLHRALTRYGGNRAQAAQVLGISERNIYRLIKLHGLG